MVGTGQRGALRPGHLLGETAAYRVGGVSARAAWGEQPTPRRPRGSGSAAWVEAAASLRATAWRCSLPGMPSCSGLALGRGAGSSSFPCPLSLLHTGDLRLAACPRQAPGRDYYLEYGVQGRAVPRLKAPANPSVGGGACPRPRGTHTGRASAGQVPAPEQDPWAAQAARGLGPTPHPVDRAPRALLCVFPGQGLCADHCRVLSLSTMEGPRRGGATVQAVETRSTMPVGTGGAPGRRGRESPTLRWLFLCESLRSGRSIISWVPVTLQSSTLTWGKERK